MTDRICDASPDHRWSLPIDEDIAAAVYRFPAPRTQADTTCEWDWMTAAVIRVGAGGHFGLGWCYGSPAIAEIVSVYLPPHSSRLSPFDIPAC